MSGKKSLSYTTVDVFTDTRFEGNQLAIVKLTDNNELTTNQMQTIAQEFNYPETIFVSPETSNKNEYHVNIFTTTSELPFAGHPTIGSAWFLLGDSKVNNSSGTLITKAGPIPIEKLTDGKTTRAKIPHNLHIHKSTFANLDLTDVLNPNPIIASAETNAPVVSIVKGMTFAMIKLPSLELLGQLSVSSKEPDLSPLLDSDWQVGLVGKYYYVVLDDDNDGIIKLRTRMIYDFEDPATGSAASGLASYLALQAKKDITVEITQGVEMGRRSVLKVEVKLKKEDPTKVQSVTLAGQTVKVMEGTINVE